MINGMHLTLYSSDQEVDELREFMRDVLRLRSFDAGGEWPIFHMPGEIGCHPDEEAESGKPARFELAFTCKDLDATVADLKKRGVKFIQEIHDAGWGRLTSFSMPGAINAVLYEPNYRRPKSR
jgi:predicted enzyme related to lactoylglutathione lyase